MLPVGTVTLLMADVEGSTKAWETDQESMRRAMAEHDRIVGEALDRHGGVRPRDQGEGDAFLAGFARPTDALSAALEIQLGLRNTTIRLRIGLHTGEIGLRNEHNYAGPTINRCARIRNVAHGGQTLLSQATYELVCDTSGTGFLDLGEHRLKDLDRPQRVWQLTHPELPGDFPPLRSMDDRRHNLPVQMTSFVGRDEEVRTVLRLLDESRLVTLTGAGGSGKTRLALQAGAEYIDHAADGVWFVDLSPFTSAEAVAEAAAAALSLSPDEAGRLAAAIGDRHMVFVLDNCEHLVDASAHLVDGLLRQCPNIKVIATTREILSVPGEVTWRVPPLERPQAVRLFADRAAKARPGFEVTDDDAAHVASICERLDGIPLAIELAAARVRMMSPEQIAKGLNDRFRLLTGGGRTLMPRQQTLRASVDWSYQLLDDDEKTALRRLSVFVGDFTLEAAEQICDVDFDTVARLADRSLLVADGERLKMLETIRTYGGEMLAADPEGPDVRMRFRDYWIAYAARPIRWWWGEGGLDALIALEDDWPNVRAAVEDAIEAGAVESALDACVGMSPGIALNGRREAGIAWVEKLRGRLSDPTMLGRLWLAQAQMQQATSASITEPAERALELLPAEAAADRAVAAWLLGLSQTSLEPAVAEETLAEALQLAEQSGDADVALVVRMYSMWPPAHQGRLDEALKLTDELFELYRARGWDLLRGWMCFYRGMLSIYGNRYEEARDAYEQAIPVLERLPHGLWLQWALDHVSAVCIRLGEPERALKYATWGVELSRRTGLLEGNYPFVLGRLASAHEELGNLGEALKWACESREFLRQRSAYGPHSLSSAICLAAVLEERCGNIEDARTGYREALVIAADLETETSRQSGMKSEPPLAGPIGGLARLAVREGDFELAARLQGAALRAQDIEGGGRPGASLTAFIETALAPAREALGDRWDVLVAEGREMEPKTAAQLALGSAE